MKNCIRCDHPARFSVCTVISTLGLPGRRQQCSTALPFCSVCLQRLCAESEGGLSRELRKAFWTAFQALTSPCNGRAGPEDAGVQGKPGVGPTFKALVQATRFSESPTLLNLRVSRDRAWIPVPGAEEMAFEETLKRCGRTCL
jgi:hypothetical protein